MTDRYNRHGPCLALVCENASRAQAMIAGTAIARAAEAMRRARGVRARGPRLRLVVRAAALRSPDLAGALAAEGVPAPTARTLAPHVHRTRARCAIVRIEPRARSPEGPWPGLLDAGPGLFDLSESGVRAFVAELQTAALPDAALPRPVYRLPINASQP